MRTVVTASINRKLPATVFQLVREGERRFKAAGLPNPRQEADLLVSHAAKLTRLQLYLSMDAPAAGRLCQEARRLFQQREKRIPIQYLIGTQEFWGLELEVTPDVLIPRPETEFMIEAAIQNLGRQPGEPQGILMDIGTGSGCIAIALSEELPRARIFATDLSREALIVAQRNAKRLGMDGRIAFFQGDLFEAFHSRGSARVRMILSNPPYVPTRELETLAPEVKNHEPRMALDGGMDGLDLCRRILREAPRHLPSGGALLMEIGHHQAGPLKDWVHRERLPWKAHFKKDLSGIDRVAILTKI